MRLRTSLTILATVLLAVPTPALAGDDEAAIVIDATQMMPRDGVHAGGTGLGAELRFVPDDECMTMSIGGFVVAGAPGTDQRRDVVDVHFQVGFKSESRIAPYVSLGLDVLHVSTHTEMRSYRGTTLGLSAQAGVLARVGDRMVLRGTAQYLGAIVPGTGDDLGGVVLQVGVGFTLDD